MEVTVSRVGGGGIARGGCLQGGGGVQLITELPYLLHVSPRHAPSVRNGNGFSLRISAVPCAAQQYPLMLHLELSGNQLRQMHDSMGCSAMCPCVIWQTLVSILVWLWDSVNASGTPIGKTVLSPAWPVRHLPPAINRQLPVPCQQP